MKKRFARKITLLIAIVFQLWLGKVFSQDCSPLPTLKITNEGLFNIIGVLPVTVQKNKRSANGIAVAEMMSYVIQQFNKQYSRNLIGYTIYDACSYNDFNRLSDIILDIILSDGNDASAGNLCPCFKESHLSLSSTLGTVSYTHLTLPTKA